MAFKLSSELVDAAKGIGMFSVEHIILISQEGTNEVTGPP
jgi:hypothetical protein